MQFTSLKHLSYIHFLIFFVHLAHNVETLVLKFLVKFQILSLFNIL